MSQPTDQFRPDPEMGLNTNARISTKENTADHSFDGPEIDAELLSETNPDIEGDITPDITSEITTEKTADFASDPATEFTAKIDTDLQSVISSDAAQGASSNFSPELDSKLRSKLNVSAANLENTADEDSKIRSNLAANLSTLEALEINQINKSKIESQLETSLAADADLISDHQIKIKLVTSRSEYQCNFWVGVSTAGDIAPSSLLSYETIDKIFEEVTDRGISENGPLMLTDTGFDPPRYVYFTTTPDNSEKDRENWLKSVSETIISWNPSTLGIYLAREALGNLNSLDLLQKLILDTVKHSEIKEIFLLCGSHGTNSILNAAHKTRIDLQDTGFKVKVYH